jgi:hypothetical protein
MLLALLAAGAVYGYNHSITWVIIQIIPQISLLRCILGYRIVYRIVYR